MNRTAARLATATAASGAALLLMAGPAAAHVGTSVKEVAAGSSTPLGLTIGHGCDGSPTTSVAVQIPEGINNATAFAKPGWTVVSEKQALETPIEAPHGDPITERVSVITFTANAGNALPNELRDVFTINFAAPDAPGATLFFKTVQSCETGSNDWIQEYDGTGEEPESPAPSIAVTEAAEEAAEVEPAEPASSSDDDSDGTPIAVVALLTGMAGLGVGVGALTKAGRSATS